MNCEVQEKPKKIHEKPKKVKTKEDLQKLYPDRFEGIGNVKGDFHITLDPIVPPIVHAPK